MQKNQAVWKVSHEIVPKSQWQLNPLITRVLRRTDIANSEGDLMSIENVLHQSPASEFITFLN